jgi:hypothetical protein
MFEAASAAVLLAMENQEVAKFVAMAAAGLHRAHHAAALSFVHGAFQAGGDVVLLIDGKREGEDDAVSFLTGH